VFRTKRKATDDDFVSVMLTEITLGRNVAHEAALGSRAPARQMFCSCTIIRSTLNMNIVNILRINTTSREIMAKKPHFFYQEILYVTEIHRLSMGEDDCVRNARLNCRQYIHNGTQLMKFYHNYHCFD
jgi:hypothetical protein